MRSAEMRPGRFVASAQSTVAGIAQKALLEAGGPAEVHDEMQTCLVRGAQVVDLPQSRVRADQQAGRQQVCQPLESGPDARWPRGIPFATLTEVSAGFDAPDRGKSAPHALCESPGREERLAEVGWQLRFDAAAGVAHNEWHVRALRPFDVRAVTWPPFHMLLTLA